MARQLGANENTSDESVLDSVGLNSSTSTKIRNAGNGFIFWCISNNSNKDLWLKLQAASVDNAKKGIFLPAGSYWTMPTDNKYLGEISAIMVNTSKTVYMTEY